MTVLGIRALKQNASAVVAQAAAGETITITDRGRPVALLVPIPDDPLERLVAAARRRGTMRGLGELPPSRPDRTGGPTATEILLAMRDEERY
ncbi:type II toxin-antitoxin system prevent-host-death family antitoxin [Antribacter sp. KLBMP9083]|uniref:Antitoxin n=1 Tax=Antribacter soli TaxID=2910976 RepID=A0AA41U7T4_9MICO|nr:type II toxin-antitoxin system prevent-host-death family antitoxin [Antribacter soli]MCF4121936.1 type II toxin-antitoxin system prevent-host-death family antitoxin [Antribacter soli]